jgi:deoxyribodipyrimidine photo-lyase
MRALHWFRNDLRLHDNTALLAAVGRADQLLPVFIVDDHLLHGVHTSPSRRRFLLDCLARLAGDLAARGCPLVVRRGDPVDALARLLAESRAELLTFNRDYTPYAKRRDARVRAAARAAGVAVQDYKDRVICERDELRTQKGAGFVVYTPFRNAWMERWRAAPPATHRLARLPRPVPGIASDPLPGPDALAAGGDATDIPAGGETAAQARLHWFLQRAVRHYARDRDRPDVDGTSRLSPYLRFGAISVRQCAGDALALAARDRGAASGARKWVDELVWRDFYLALLDEHPRVLGGAFRREFGRVRWNDDAAALRAWREGRTGYPFVDAAMRQLVQTGWMHNRARMIVASFLTKDLLLDWRLGERVFMHHLIDGEPASNNGGWQWSASTGTDAQPYFRVFNPVLQGQKFDPAGAYVRRYVAELRELPDRYIHRPWDAPTPPRDYPPPIVDHAERRVLAVARYAAARGGAARRIC